MMANARLIRCLDRGTRLPIVLLHPEAESFMLFYGLVSIILMLIGH